ncbi:hypothetical protein HZF24_13245 [Sedimentibacter hydroxybenzoicus DSM 7310]|uniref:Uncharacterized protein n=1 Tax=Sedimentibacter hydroxybenzoicus DSM 7310 TaxID=1123245 RepID=A0A974BL10_SEDHY|nr:hypothetical protein [Sedimentibacter hydroxybenzoicus]NYB75108.1 hypothetical protein [Sedimentibacter hydroxybenzoicus DSM 7310]
MRLNSTQTIEIERLLLRKYTLNDAEAMYNNWAINNEPYYIIIPALK